MTLRANFEFVNQGSLPMGISGLPLDTSSVDELIHRGSTIRTVHRMYGEQKYMYVRFTDASTAGDLKAFVANTAVNNITAGTTTTITTAGLTADQHVGGILYCLDDDGGAGAAPEGEHAEIIANTATVITVHPNDAFSVSPAANDDFVIIRPWAVDDAGVGDTAAECAGLTMADQAANDYGFVLYQGIGLATAIAAGTTIPTNEAVIAAAGGVVTDGAGATVDLRIGKSQHALTTDTVVRGILVDFMVGKAASSLDNSTA